MKSIKCTVTIMIATLLFSCGGGGSLPNELIDNSEGYEQLTDYIVSHYANLDDGLEILEFRYSASVEPQRDALTSSLSIDFVRGDDKNRIVNYRIQNDGRFFNNNVDISVGGPLEEELSNSYETYEPFLFSSKQIDFDVFNSIMKKSMEQFKKEANVENAYCNGLTMEIKNEPFIRVSISQKKFASSITRTYSWSFDGKTQKK